MVHRGISGFSHLPYDPKDFVELISVGGHLRLLHIHMLLVLFLLLILSHFLDLLFRFGFLLATLDLHITSLLRGRIFLGLGFRTIIIE